MGSRRALLFRLIPLFALVVLLAAQPAGPRVVFIPYGDAEPILQAMAEALPEPLKGLGSEKLKTVWPIWVKGRDADIRSRLERGDEDSVTNFLMFGTSFTQQPRLTAAYLQKLREGHIGNATDPSANAASGLVSQLAARADDLIKALVAPGTNDRLLFAQRVLKRNGYSVATAAQRAAAKQFLIAHTLEVLKEYAGYVQALETARRLGNATEELAARSTLFQNRGLSLDTLWPPDFAIEETLRTLRQQGLIAPGSVRRVAIIGPGLDFTDKQEGYDFYKPQTIQPFAVFDSLVRLGLAKGAALDVTTLDISPRVNEHIARAVERAQRGLAYVVQLPLDPAVHWEPDAMHYWEEIGTAIGAAVVPVAAPNSVGNLKVRAIRIQPNVVKRVHAVDLDIVLERLELPVDERFDLIIATNIFVYYDVFEQSLALTNVQAMLWPGGFLLSNNALLELPSSLIRSVGYSTVVYSDRRDDGDHIIWYRVITK
jgi:hypothetical protein